MSLFFRHLPKCIVMLVFLFGLLQIGSAAIPISSDISDNTVDILHRFAEKIKSLSAYEMKFSMLEDGSEFVGVVQVQGTSYRLTSAALEFYCNGTTKWALNIENKELTILTNDPSQTELSENPLALFVSFEKDYSYSEKARSASANGKPAWRIELKPLNKRLAYTSITLTIEKSAFKPVSIEYLAKNGAKHIAKISTFLEKPTWPATYFTFPTTRMSGLTVTDLR